MVHAANTGTRKDPDGLKVGGHQASSASMVSIMTALWFTVLQPQDRVSVKPHASPVLHAIHYLLGELDETQMGTLRAYHGLQSYPSRSKDPGTIDYSTGSVGIGATAPIWGAVARRYTADLTGAERSRAPPVLTGRGRRTRRGRGVGGRARPRCTRARRTRLGRRLQPAVTRPRRAEHLGTPGCRLSSRRPDGR